MGRKKTEINPIRGQRLKELLADNKMKQTELAEKIHLTPEHISGIVQGKRNLTEETAQAVAALFPPIQSEWLLGYTDYKTQFDQFRDEVSKIHDTHSCIVQLLALHGYTFIEKDYSKAAWPLQQAYSSHAVEVRNNRRQSIVIPHSQWQAIIGDIDWYTSAQMKRLFEAKEDKHG